MPVISISRSLERWFAAGTALLALLVFAPALGAGFLYDDQYFILIEPRVHFLHLWPRWFTEPFWPMVVNQGLWRPLVLASCAFTWQLFGPSEIAFHLTNLLLHSLATWLVWLTARRMGLSAAAALVSALVFAVHPIHSEVACGVIYRTDSMAAAAILAALALFLGALERPRAWWLATPLIALLHLAALMSKENTVLFPLFLLAALLTLRPAAAGRHLTPLAVSALLVTATYIWVKIHVTGAFGIPAGTRTYAGSTLSERLPAVPLFIVEYARLLVFPVTLALDYQMPLPSGSAVIPLLALLTAMAVAWLVAVTRLLRAGHRVLAFALVWTTLALGPYLHILPIGAAYAERFAYLASVGVCWFAGGLIDALPRHRSRLVAGLLAVSVFFAARSLRQAVLWTEPRRLWEATVAVSPGSERAWVNLGNVYRGENEILRAREAYRRGFEANPGNRFARAGLARTMAALGDAAGGEQILREGLWENPDEPHMACELAELLVLQDRASDAVEVVESAVLAQPDFPRLWYNLAVARAAAGNVSGARGALREARNRGYHDEERMAELEARLGR
ncbi:MAG: glycosyltransferase family 39 protein [Candidatus Sumerlaeia bacterium]|nr:glycosyltransferase family 39 protein [Candidatus Sumerlaeia bacterium]